MPELHGTSFFAFGFSLFLLPAFWIFNNPASAYTASLVVSALLMSTVYISLYYVLVSHLGVSSRLAMLVSFVTCLYPPLILRANFTWAENAYVPCFIVLGALFGALLRYKTWRIALAFGLLLGFMYTIHARSLPLIPISAAYLIVLGVLGVLTWRVLVTALAATSVVFIATRRVISHLGDLGGSANPEISMSEVVSHFFSLRGLHDFVLTTNMQFLYVLQSSLGLFLVGLLALGYTIWKQRSDWVACFTRNVPTATLTFYVLAWLGTLALAAAHLARPSESIHFLLGRYVDGNSAPILAIGLSSLFTVQQRTSRRLGVVYIVYVGLGTALALYGLSVFSPIPFVPSTLGTYPILANFGTNLGLIIASVLAATGFIAFQVVSGRLRYLAVLALVTFFLLSSAYSYFFAILPLQERVVRSTSLAAYIQTYIGSPATIAYDTAAYHPLTYFTYEYLLPHTRFIPFDSSAGESPPAPVVIASANWSDAHHLNAHFWQAEPLVPLVGADQALWTLPGPQQSVLAQHANYTNSVLGIRALPAFSIQTTPGIQSQPIWGLRHAGLYHPVDPNQDPNLVWFVSQAELRVPTGSHPPQALLLNLVSTVQRNTPLSVSVNDHSLFNDSVPPNNWCQLFPLHALPVSSATLVSLSIPSLSDTDASDLPARFVIRGITLLDHLPNLTATLSANPLPPSAYKSHISLASPPQLDALVQGAMTSARLTVTNSGDQPWPTPCETGQTPGTVQLGILWFPLNSSNRDLADSVSEGRAALPYALSPGNSISLTAVLAPFSPAGDPLPPGDYEIWIGPVQEGVAWFFQHNDDVLKLRVKIVK
jgi:hypothetical protein